MKVMEFVLTRMVTNARVLAMWRVRDNGRGCWRRFDHGGDVEGGTSTIQTLFDLAAGGASLAQDQKHRPESSNIFGWNALARVPKPKNLEDFRVIALSWTSCKWYVRMLVGTIQSVADGGFQSN